MQHRFIQPHKPAWSGIGKRLLHIGKRLLCWTHQSRWWSSQQWGQSEWGQSCCEQIRVVHSLTLGGSSSEEIRCYKIASTVNVLISFAWVTQAGPTNHFHCWGAERENTSDTSGIWSHLKGPDQEVNYTVSLHLGCLKSAVNNERR